MATFSMSTAESPPASDGVAVVVMGVSGAGKTTVGRGLAAALGGVFVDGDDLHTEAARAKMRSGQALTDEDRWPWLDRIGGALAEGLEARATDRGRLLGPQEGLPRPSPGGGGALR